MIVNTAKNIAALAKYGVKFFRRFRESVADLPIRYASRQRRDSPLRGNFAGGCNARGSSGPEPDIATVDRSAGEAQTTWLGLPGA